MRLQIACARPVRATLKLRHPYWSTPAMAVRLNGRRLDAGRPGTYLELTRRWRDGDVLEIELRTPLRIERMAHHPSKLAILAGTHRAGGRAGRCADAAAHSLRGRRSVPVGEGAGPGRCADACHPGPAGRGLGGGRSCAPARVAYQRRGSTRGRQPSSPSIASPASAIRSTSMKKLQRGSRHPGNPRD